MMQLVQGWLAVAWGHSVLYLLVFGVARVLPKVVLTVPAGIVCDRVSRKNVLVCSRLFGGMACLLPLGGLFLALPMAWLIAGIVLGGIVHAFDLPAGRAVLGDLTVSEDLDRVVTLNNMGSHFAALAGPPLAFILGPWGLVPAAALMFVASLIASTIREHRQALSGMSEADGFEGLVRYAVAAPAVSGLMVLGIAPGILDKAVPLVVPSMAAGVGTTSLALLAPELGGLLTGLVLSVAQVHCGRRAIVFSALAYPLLLGIALGFSYESELLIIGLLLAGAVKLTLNTGSQVRMQQTVPSGMRGRVFSF